MSLRKFKAEKLFDGYHLHDEMVLITTEDGRIESIVPSDEAGDGLEILTGVISPGLINCHCHLELSHLKNIIPPGTGLIDFLLTVVKKRDFPRENILDAMVKAEDEMQKNGIVGVGDVCNTSMGINLKKTSSIRWHNFIEVANLSEERTKLIFDQYQQILSEHIEELPMPNRSVLSPHAPYSLTNNSLDLIDRFSDGKIISIHNQENPAEDELFRSGQGEFHRLFNALGYPNPQLEFTGRSSLQSWLPHFNLPDSIFLVHNTYMKKEDAEFAAEYALSNNIDLIICLCPNANIYIENRLPDVELFFNNNFLIVLGTDSYSSNWELSLVKEMQTLMGHPYFKTIPFDEGLKMVLQFATLNGAKAMKWDNEFGSFDKGKKPGLVLISNDLSSSRRLL